MNEVGTKTSGGISMSVKMATSIFLQPVPPQKRIIYLEAHNTSSAVNLNFRSKVIAGLKNNGYKITDNPDVAAFMLLYNIKYVGQEKDGRTMEGALIGGFGGAMGGALTSGSGRSPWRRGAIGGMLGSLVGAGVGYVTSGNKYMMVIDIQLEQRHKGAVISTKTSMSQGLNNYTDSHTSKIRGWQIYRNRIIAQASGTRLSFDVAEPYLVNTLSHEIYELF